MIVNGVNPNFIALTLDREHMKIIVETLKKVNYTIETEVSKTMVSHGFERTVPDVHALLMVFTRTFGFYTDQFKCNNGGLQPEPGESDVTPGGVVQ